MTRFEDFARDNTNQATVGADGIATVSFGPMMAGVVWEVQQVTLETYAFAATSASLVKNSSFTVCSSPLFINTAGGGVSATASGPPYVYLWAQDLLTAVLAGGTQGDQLSVSWIYRVGVTY